MDYTIDGTLSISAGMFFFFKEYSTVNICFKYQIFTPAAWEQTEKFVVSFTDDGS